MSGRAHGSWALSTNWHKWSYHMPVTSELPEHTGQTSISWAKHSLREKNFVQRCTGLHTDACVKSQIHTTMSNISHTENKVRSEPWLLVSWLLRVVTDIYIYRYTISAVTDFRWWQLTQDDFTMGWLTCIPLMLFSNYTLWSIINYYFYFYYNFLLDRFFFSLQLTFWILLTLFLSSLQYCVTVPAPLNNASLTNPLTMACMTQNTRLLRADDFNTAVIL